MAEEESTQPPEIVSIETTFQTWHNSNGDLHLRTQDQILHIDKKAAELIAQAKRLNRGARIRVSGRHGYSKTLSTRVLHVDSLDCL